MLDRLCGPALIYFFFSITHVVMDTGKGLYNSALMKLVVTILFTIFLNYLCDSGMQLIAWFIVFIPFILMTLIISILLYVFGLDPASGKINLNYPGKHTPEYPDPRKHSSVDTHGSSISTQRNPKQSLLRPDLLQHYLDTDIEPELQALGLDKTNHPDHTADKKTAGDLEKEKKEERTNQQNQITTDSFMDNMDNIFSL